VIAMDPDVKARMGGLWEKLRRRDRSSS